MLIRKATDKQFFDELDGKPYQMLEQQHFVYILSFAHKLASLY